MSRDDDVTVVCKAIEDVNTSVERVRDAVVGNALIDARTYLAGQALCALITKNAKVNDAEHLARMCVDAADLVLAELAKTGTR